MPAAQGSDPRAAKAGRAATPAARHIPSSEPPKRVRERAMRLQGVPRDATANLR